MSFPMSDSAFNTFMFILCTHMGWLPFQFLLEFTVFLYKFYYFFCFKLSKTLTGWGSSPQFQNTLKVLYNHCYKEYTHEGRNQQRRASYISPLTSNSNCFHEMLIKNELFSPLSIRCVLVASMFLTV